MKNRNKSKSGNKNKEQLKKLAQKYEVMGQDMTSYLDGLLYSNFLKYWEYIHLDTLLTLQNPQTDFPDEMVFIIYHQITELYFKLILHEIDQIAHNKKNVSPSGEDVGWGNKLPVDFFIERLNRINKYFENLTRSFEIMINGMEKDQFLKFRMALLPASGFQSAQYRMIEICSTDLIRLVDPKVRGKFETRPGVSIEELFSHRYWKKGSTELASGKKTLTLLNFEKKYSNRLIKLAKEYKNINLWAKYKTLPKKDQKNKDLIKALRQLDMNANINWSLVHYKSAVRYLDQKPDVIAATGGTNWQKYLPPRFQKIVFFPDLWTREELKNWGKQLTVDN